VASDGTDGLMLGQIPQFYGPDGVWEVWLSANNGPRVRAQALDVADLVSDALVTIDNATGTLDDAAADHDSIGQPNGLATLGADGILTTAQRPPSVTSLSSLTDVSTTGVVDHSTLRYKSSTSKWSVVNEGRMYAAYLFSDNAANPIHVTANDYSGIGGSAPTVVASHYSQVVDTAGILNATTGIATIATTGFYQVSGHVEFQNHSVDKCGAWILITGSLVWTGDSSEIFKCPDTPTWNASISMPLYLTAGDTVRLGIFHNASIGGTRDVAAAFFSINQIS
jgi:hypothetical protein